MHFTDYIVIHCRCCSVVKLQKNYGLKIQLYMKVAYITHRSMGLEQEVLQPIFSIKYCLFSTTGHHFGTVSYKVIFIKLFFLALS